MSLDTCSVSVFNLRTSRHDGLSVADMLREISLLSSLVRLLPGRICFAGWRQDYRALCALPDPKAEGAPDFCRDHIQDFCSRRRRRVPS